MSEQDDNDLEVLHEDVDLVEDDDDLEVLEDDPDNDEELLSEDEPDTKRKDLPPVNREIIKLRKQRQSEQRENRELREQLARVSGQVDVISRRPDNTAEVQRQEQERLANMSAEERADYRISQQQTQFSQALAGVEFRAADRADKSDFRDLCRINPAVAEIAQEVEDRIAKLRRDTGTNVEREIMADKILGERVRMKAVKNLDKQRARNEEKTRQHTARAPGARSDVAGERTTKRANMTARERLEAQEAKGINPFRSR